MVFNLESLDYLSKIAQDIHKIINMIWNYKLFTMDSQPVHISNVILAIIFMFVGFKIAKYLKKLIFHKLLKPMHLDNSISNLLDKIIYYILLIIVTIIVLDIAHVPLTIFTFIGGALAISLGVGGQHVMNNFISGIVLMIENPIKIGDIIEFSDIIGKVISIDARSVNVQTHENKNVFIPHSLILQNQVTNWTSNDHKLKISTNLKIIQGSTDLNELKRIIFNILEQSQDILLSPKPQILLIEFDYNIINLEINFWVNVAFVNRREIISKINFMIYNALINHKISLASPVRKVIK